jgi:hypothetical protein
VIRYGSRVWSDHRRGMFHGATERQGDYNYRCTKVISKLRSTSLLSVHLNAIVSINYAHATVAQGATLCRAMVHGPT